MTGETVSWIGLRLLGDRYRITGRLGEGGMGFVYKAWDSRLDCDVVIKVPRASLLADPSFAERFQREIRSLVQLVHPHIVKVTDVGEHDGLPFAVLQYLPGGSLRDRQVLGTDGQPLPMPAEQLVHWLEPVATALDFIHSQRFIHRDVKPDNILFDGQGHVYLSDFGVAKVVAADDATPGHSPAGQTTADRVLGSPAYMAPELILGETYDGRVDQYGLAVSIFELLAGKVPFTAPKPTAVLMHHVNRPPPALNQVLPTVPWAISAAVQRGLAKDPRDRFRSCTELAQAVLIAARPASGAMPAPPPPPAQARAVAESAPTAARYGQVVTCPVCRKAAVLPPTGPGQPRQCPSCQAVLPDSGPGRWNVGLRTIKGKLRRLGPRTPYWLAGVLGVVLLGIGLIVWRATRPDRPPSPPVGPSAGPATPRALVGALRIIPPSTITLAAGASRTVEVRVERQGRMGPIAVELQNLPAGITASAGVIEPGFDRVELRLDVSLDAAEAKATARLVAGTAEEQVTEPIRVEVVTATGEIRRHDQDGAILTCLAFLPGGRQALAAGTDRVLRLLDVATGKELTRFTGHTDVIQSLAVSADGRRAVTGSLDRTLRVWDVPAGKELTTLQGHADKVLSVALSADGKLALSGGQDDTLRLWDVDSGKEMQPGFPKQPAIVTAVALSPDGRQALSASGQTVFLWDVLKRQQLHRFEGHEAPIWCVAFTPDGQYAFSGSGLVDADGKGQDCTVRMWDPATGQAVRSFTGHNGHVFSIAVSPDGHYILSGGWDNTVRLWDRETGSEVECFRTHVGKVMNVAYSPDGRRALSAGADRTLRLYNLPKPGKR